MKKLNYDYKQPIITFTVPSAYTATPLVFCLRRKTEPTGDELRAMRFEIDLLEEWANTQDDTFTQSFCQSYLRRMRGAFAKVLKGYRHLRITQTTIWRKATRLNELGENDYIITSIERDAVEAWKESDED